jgi:hypothetical protein
MLHWKKAGLLISRKPLRGCATYQAANDEVDIDIDDIRRCKHSISGPAF